MSKLLFVSAACRQKLRLKEPKSTEPPIAFFESGEYRQQMAPMQVKFLSFEIFACALQGGSTILVPATK
jgi:hypothetical protein